MYNYTRRYCAKNRESILRTNVPESVVVETWAAFEEGESVVMGDGQRVDFGNLKVEVRIIRVCERYFIL